MSGRLAGMAGMAGAWGPGVEMGWLKVLYGAMGKPLENHRKTIGKT